MEPLTMHDVITLSAIVQAAINGKRVAWIHHVTEEVIYGTARSIGDGIGNFLKPVVDVRDGFLRITSNAGSDYILPMSTVTRMYDEGAFVVDPVMPFPPLPGE
jgi:phage-related protein